MILDEIIAHKQIEIAERKQQIPLADIRTRAESADAPRDFACALTGAYVALIAEIKRASPSRGALNAHADPPSIAKTYAAHDASAISVLTDEKYFNGRLDDLEAVRATINLPVLRKDFIVDEYQVYESRAASADAILLIVRVLTDAQLFDYLTLTHTLGMNALVEIHDERDLERALAVNAHIIGINNRNLADFTVDLGITERLAPRIGGAAIIVAESGVFARGDVERAARAGARAVLVGEALMRAADIAATVRELASVPSGKML